MVNTITTTTVLDNEDKTIVKVDILGDGSGEETNTLIYDVNNYKNPTTKTKLNRVWGDVSLFLAKLLWDATVNKPLINIGSAFTSSPHYIDFTYFGGIINNGGAGQTGNILLTTLNLAADEAGYFILEVGKRKYSRIK